MMKGIKMNALMELPCNKIRFPLPQVGVELEAASMPQQGMQPAREVHVMELHAGERLLLECSFNSVTVLGRSKNPELMHPVPPL
jgi:hypothetical protein